MGSNTILTKDNMTEVIPKWQHPILPGRAVQGSLLFTTTDFINPPQSAADFTWIAMEEICGIHDTKCYYDEKDNVYHFYKSIGHLNNDETWAEDWYEFASVQGISKEAQEMLETMEYIVYRFNQEPTEFGTHFTVVGVRKDMSEDTICDMYLPDKDYIDRQDIKYQPIDGKATSVIQDGDNGRIVNVLVDNDTITINDNNELVAEGAVADEYTIHKEDGTHIISVIPNRDKGIDTSVNGVEAKVDNDSIDFNTDGQLHAIGDIRDGIATHIGDHIDSDNVHYKDVDVLVDETKGITVNDNNKVAAKITGTEGLEFDTDGNIKARVDGATVRIDEYGRLEAVPVEVREGKAIDIRKVEDEGDPYYVVDAIGDGTTIGYNERTDLKVIPNTAKGITTSTKGVEAKIKDGLVFDTAGNINVDPDNDRGLAVEPSGKVYVRKDTKDSTYFNDNGELCADADVRDDYGIKIEKRLEGDDGHKYKIVRLNANLDEVQTPLGDESSHITLHSDGKISVDTNDKIDRQTIVRNTNDELTVQPNTNRGITKSASGVEAKVDEAKGTTIAIGGAIGVKICPANNQGGLKIVDVAQKSQCGLAINANFTVVDDSLGTTPSNIILHRGDGKLEVKGNEDLDELSITRNDNNELMVRTLHDNDSGLMITSNRGVKIDEGKGLIINNTTHQLETYNDSGKGLTYSDRGGNHILNAINNGMGLDFETDDEPNPGALKLNANFTTSTEPLGTNPSNIILHSDGKIECAGGSGDPDNKTIHLTDEDKLQVMIRGNGSSSSISSGTGGLDWEYNSGIDNGLYVKAGKGITLNTTTDQLEPALRFDRENNRDWSGIAYQNGSMSVKGGLYVKTNKGITIDDTNSVGINANFDVRTDALGDVPSGLELYSDGKIRVTSKGGFIKLAEESALSSAERDLTIPGINNYKLFFICVPSQSGVYILSSIVANKNRTETFRMCGSAIVSTGMELFQFSFSFTPTGIHIYTPYVQVLAGSQPYTEYPCKFAVYAIDV